MSKKHKKKARVAVASKSKPHNAKEANRRKRLRDHERAKRVSSKARQSTTSTKRTTTTTTTTAVANTTTTDDHTARKDPPSASLRASER
jgi:hypothetical protein